MPHYHLSNRVLTNLETNRKSYFIRDTVLKGFGVKVNPKGQKKYVVEVWYNNSSTRKTIGEFPYMSVQDARRDALQVISDIKSGLYDNDLNRKDTSLEKLFTEYLGNGRLKQRTIVDYKEAINFYLFDWLDTPVNAITKKMVEKRFYLIKDNGVQGGKPTHSQAAKTMRILSALLNYAKGDDLIEVNPVEILKLKKVDRSIKPKTSYLRPREARELINAIQNEDHPGALAVLLMLYTGLRRNEALSIQWSDIREIDEDLSVITIGKTKNSQPHYVPVTSRIKEVLARATNNSKYVFPSTQNPRVHMSYLRAIARHLSKTIGRDFTPHDLRRTFATRASEVGIDYLMIKNC